MIGLDTNVLIRYIVRDDQRQAAAATRLIESRCTPDDPGLINRIVLCELVWVLSRGYGYDRQMTARVVRRDPFCSRISCGWGGISLESDQTL